jgi:DNA-binding CsgD family transcriptional regulator
MVRKDIRIKKGKKAAEYVLSVFNHGIFTEKQLECLKLRAEGKSVNEIGRILGKSKQAVSNYIQCAARKAYKHVV